MPTRRMFFSAIAFATAGLWPYAAFGRQRRRRRRVAQPTTSTSNSDPITRGSFPTGYYYRDRDIEFVVPDLTKWSKLCIGMTSADVRRLLGPPLEDDSREDPEYRRQITVDLPDEPSPPEVEIAGARDADDSADKFFRESRYLSNEYWSYGQFKFLTNDLYWRHFGVSFVADYLDNIYDPFGGDVDEFGIPHSQHLSYDGRPTVPQLLTPYPNAKLTHEPFILDSAGCRFAANTRSNTNSKCRARTLLTTTRRKRT